jgi:hypothetical protein
MVARHHLSDEGHPAETTNEKEKKRMRVNPNISHPICYLIYAPFSASVLSWTALQVVQSKLPNFQCKPALLGIQSNGESTLPNHQSNLWQ